MLPGKLVVRGCTESNSRESSLCECQQILSFHAASSADQPLNSSQRAEGLVESLLRKASQTPGDQVWLSSAAWNIKFKLSRARDREGQHCRKDKRPFHQSLPWRVPLWTSRALINPGCLPTQQAATFYLQTWLSSTGSPLGARQVVGASVVLVTFFWLDVIFHVNVWKQASFFASKLMGSWTTRGNLEFHMCK